jgi:hypothetical protein
MRPKCCSPPRHCKTPCWSCTAWSAWWTNACLATCPAFATSSAPWATPTPWPSCAPACKACACAPAPPGAALHLVHAAHPHGGAVHPSQDEQALRDMVADYLRRPALNALPAGQRQLISLVLWKLLASSSYAIGGALGTMAQRLQDQLSAQPAGQEDAEPGRASWTRTTSRSTKSKKSGRGGWRSPGAPSLASVAEEIAELREFQRMATTIRDNAKGQALLTPWAKPLPSWSAWVPSARPSSSPNRAARKTICWAAGAKRLRRPNRAVQRHQQQ